MYKRNNSGYLAAIVLAVFLLSLLAVYASSAQTKDLKLSARAAVLYQPETKTFLYEKNANEKRPMASTTKIMTALVTLENVKDLSEPVRIDPSAIGTEGSSAYLKDGDTVTVQELLYALMLRSANDAAVALACFVGGDTAGFAAMMNERAEKLGLTDTHFANPHGLDDKEHYTTAEDLAIIAAEALKNEQFTEICSTYKKTLVSGERRRTYINHNKLLYKYEGAIGVKTGFTDESGRCLVGAAERDGLRFITVTLDAPTDWADHKALFDYGYERLERLPLASVYKYSYDLPHISGAKIRITNTAELSVIVPKGDHDIKEYIILPRYIIGNIKKGDELGYVEFRLDGEVVGRVPLSSTESVSVKEDGIFKKILNFIFG